MELKRWLANGSMMAAIGVMAFMPPTSVAMSAQNSAAVQQASGCITTTLTPEARNLLNDVWRDAEQVARDTASLKSFANVPNIDRGVQDHRLMQIQAKVADMDNRLLQLEGQALPPSDQRAIHEAMPLVQSMANDTTDAIGDLEARTQYGGYAQMLNEEATTVAREISTGEYGAS